MKRKEKIKAEIVAEYVGGDRTYRDLEAIYGYGASTIFRWVKEAELKKSVKGKKEVSGKAGSTGQLEEELRKENERLRTELKKAEMHNEILNAMMDIAEDEMGVDIRKKRGSGR
jgi:transposase-like protein